MRECTKCKKLLELTQFNKKTKYHDGLDPHCKECKAKKSASYYEVNKEKKKAYAARYYEENKEVILINRDKHVDSIRIKSWRKKNKEHVKKYARDYTKRKQKEDPIYLLRKRIRNRLGDILRQRGWKKTSSLTESIGCTYEVLKLHIESQFKSEMSWDNYGKWEIDHKQPLASAKTPEEVLKLNHYTNLQPMWALENRIKGAKT